MDSINREQPEQNRADLTAAEARQKIKELIESAGTCFFCTSTSTSESSGTRPMSVQQVDGDGNLWFLSADDSHKNLEVTTEPTVKLYFQGSAHSEFLELEGTASIVRNQEKIRELWKPVLKTWFTEGVDDPRITAIKFVPTQGYYWDTKHGPLVAGVKMLIGAALGKTLDDSIEGKLAP